MRFIAGAAAALVLLALLGALVCSVPSGRNSGPTRVDLAAITGIAASANASAAALERHASALEADTSTSDSAAVREYAESLAAGASSLRFLADSARAVVRVQGAPAAAGGTNLSGMLSDGLTLQQLGEALLDQIDELEASFISLREETLAGQAPAGLDSLEVDLRSARSTAQAAISQGSALAEQARRIARSLGTKID